ncbi:CapA family protein [Curtobacterium sp. PhB115]|uniref:CapA family protein n=1 Tax=Curtobacterium sp. PhB115 TaxID=2485173 RepID=UPI000F4CE156|nr:CapA family protein [Curtobacterium sp. PhB115]ROP66753.1 putative membrane protein YcfT [Curtobacterium sp. PhB115]
MTAAPAPSPTRDGWGDAAKGILIVLVVFWHVLMKQYLQVDWRLGVPVPGAWGLLGDVVWPFLMPLFLLVSGFYASAAVARPWAAVLRPKVLRFLYLYLLWSLIHAVAMRAFPDFPTLVPRTVTEFVEAVTISPPDTWYLYALALWFVVAKVLRRVSPWLVIGAAAVLTVAVSAGATAIVGNRGSLLADGTFFLLGVHLAPQIRRLLPRVTLPVVLGLVAAYGAAFAAMRLSGTQQVPGVWPAVALLGTAAGLSAAPSTARLRVIGPALVRLGRRSLPVYLLHMPLLAVVDAVATGWLSDARPAVQLVAAVAWPVVLTAVLVAVCLLLARLADRDGARWLFDLPARRTSTAPGPTMRRRLRAPWRLTLAVALLAACTVAGARATAVPGCADDVRTTAATTPGRVSIGGVGDVLLHDVGHRVPVDGGAGHFDAVRSWFTQDLVTGNLEQVIADDTGFDKCGDRADCLSFRSERDAAQYLEGFDLMNLANNHTGDHGPEGYAATADALSEQGIASVGARDQIVCTDIGGTRVAVIGFAPYSGTNRVTDLRHVRQVVAAAAATADVVVVHAHMGAEGPEANVVSGEPESVFGEDRGNVRAFAHAAVDAGADLVLGHGPHSLRGTEWHAGKLIAYSLGNFGGGGVFGAEQATRYGVYLDITLDHDGSFVSGRLRSVTFEHADGRPVPDPSGRAAALVDRFGQRDFPTSAPTIDDAGVLAPPPQART